MVHSPPSGDMHRHGYPEVLRVLCSAGGAQCSDWAPFKLGKFCGAQTHTSLRFSPAQFHLPFSKARPENGRGRHFSGELVVKAWTELAWGRCRGEERKRKWPGNGSEGDEKGGGL